MWYFHVLQSLKNHDWLYKGSTNDLQRRLSQHNHGEVDSTVPHRPFRESSVKTSGSVSVPLLKRIRESLGEPVIGQE